MKEDTCEHCLLNVYIIDICLDGYSADIFVIVAENEDDARAIALRGYQCIPEESLGIIVKKVPRKVGRHYQASHAD